MAVPEAAVDEDDEAVARHHDVGRAAQAARVRAEAEALAVEQAADGEFGPRARPADRRHDAASHRRGTVSGPVRNGARGRGSRARRP